ncbi:MAG TPA: hypothetical protein VFM66_06730, partial [Agromyces sp.]|nr:hypothetical protein [Agromyces sp.]
MMAAFAMIAVVTTPVSAAASGNGPAIRGQVVLAGAAVHGAIVDLYVAGQTAGTATLISSETTDARGRFTASVANSVDEADVLYATARGGAVNGVVVPDTVELATSLGDLRKGKVVIDEMTTVAAGYSLAQFAAAGVLGGASPGLQNAARMPRNLVDLAKGEPSRFLLRDPNGTSTETLATFNSLASIIAGCAEGTNDCDAFLDAATDAWGVRPATTWQAMTSLPKNPSGDASGVFAQVPDDPRFTPVRTSETAAWV